ncbi:hypothetical protein ACFIOY_19585 [Bradyrhizobium sp. TZ2]
MIYIYGLLSGFFESQQIMQAEPWSGEVAQQPWLGLRNEQQDNVVYVDFKAIREAEEGT